VSILNFLAQTPPPAGAPAGSGKPPWADLLASPMLPLMLGLLVLFIVMSRSKKKQEQQRKNLLDALKKGDRVVTIGGEIGTVVEARENEVVLKVDESSNTKIHYLRSAIHRLLDEDKAK
jgi:preprotein translocase subunit YajC